MEMFGHDLVSDLLQLAFLYQIHDFVVLNSIRLTIIVKCLALLQGARRSWQFDALFKIRCCQTTARRWRSSLAMGIAFETDVGSAFCPDCSPI